MFLKKVFIWIPVLAMLFLACEQSNKPEKLSRMDRRIADSLYRAEMKNMRAYTDSLCEIYRKKAIQLAIDSIQEERTNEIVKQLERIKNVQ